MLPIIVLFVAFFSVVGGDLSRHGLLKVTGLLFAGLLATTMTHWVLVVGTGFATNSAEAMFVTVLVVFPAVAFLGYRVNRSEAKREVASR